jgi:hypothetical protein
MTHLRIIKRPATEVLLQQARISSWWCELASKRGGLVRTAFLATVIPTTAEGILTAKPVSWSLPFASLLYHSGFKEGNKRV